MKKETAHQDGQTGPDYRPNEKFYETGHDSFLPSRQYFPEPVQRHDRNPIRKSLTRNPLAVISAVQSFGMRALPNFWISLLED